MLNTGRWIFWRVWEWRGVSKKDLVWSGWGAKLSQEFCWIVCFEVLASYVVKKYLSKFLHKTWNWICIYVMLENLMTKTLCLDVENSEFRLVPSSGIHFTQLVDRINIPVTFHISYFLHNVQYDVTPTPIQRSLQSCVQFHEEEYASTTCLCYQEHTVLFLKIHSYCQRVKIF